jgi:hypothetical protein
MSVIEPKAAKQPLIETLLPKIPLWGKFQTTGYSVALTQVAVGIVSAIYVLVTQANYFGFSFKDSWDNLAIIWHVDAVPFIGNWMVLHFDIFRHVFLRDDPESIVAYALVAMVVVKLAPMKKKVPFIDYVMVKYLRMPSRYQARLGRHPNTSGLQYLFLLPALLLMALPGEILASGIIFGGMALAHKEGVGNYTWLTPTAWWVPIAIGIAGGAFWGHKPAIKAGDDVQEFFLGKRLSLVYAADEILNQFVTAQIDHDTARNELTAMRRTAPGVLYPISYQLKYEALLDRHDPVRHYGKRSTVAIVLLVTVLVILAIYGLYIRKWGVTHGFWTP